MSRLRIRVEPDETVELTLEAPDLAAAAAKAIRTLERAGRRVVLLEVVDRTQERTEPDTARQATTPAARSSPCLFTSPAAGNPQLESVIPSMTPARRETRIGSWSS